jgi:hypothetical protein
MGLPQQTLLNLHKKKLLPSAFDRGVCVAQELKHGALIPLKHPLPPIRVPNAPSTAIHGVLFTDTVASWVKQGYVADPFRSPPFHATRFNSMMAVEQKNKVRVIMNLSAPPGASLNDAIDDLALEKVVMSTAKSFGYSVDDCSPGALMWKYDLVDAYKNIPAAVTYLRLQAFSWLGMGFVETQKVFGDTSSVATFDRLGNTLASLATAISGLPPRFAHRTLDDTPHRHPPKLQLGPRLRLRLP